MTEVFIYALYDPRDGTLRYVGKSKNLARRMKNHRNEKGERRKNRWFRLLISLGLEPKIAVLEQVPETTWQERECWWIKHFRENGCDLLNHTDGGEGLNGASAETRAKMSASIKKRLSDPVFRARMYTKERALKISASLRGKKKSAEHTAKMRQNNTGRKLTEQHKAKIRLNARGHRWTKEDGKRIAQENLGNRYGIGNKSNTGRKSSEIKKLRIAEFQRGKPKTVLTRQRMSATRKIWWEKRKANVELLGTGSKASCESTAK
jgi:group I intron endonuclease